MHADTLQRVRDKRLIFTITTGRSGTLYLARVLGLFPGVHARHEPKPTFSSAFRTVCTAPAAAREFWLEHKLPVVARIKAPIYAETSHLVCKGFLESLVALELRPELVQLRRRPREVALSLLALGTVPGRSYKGVKYYLSPSDDSFLPLPDLAREELTDYQLCYWYCLEADERARVYTERFAPLGIRVVRVELAEILTAPGIAALGERLQLPTLGLRGRLASGRIGQKKWNSRPEKKRPVTLTDEELAEMEREVSARVTRGALAGS